MIIFVQTDYALCFKIRGVCPWVYSRVNKKRRTTKVIKFLLTGEVRVEEAERKQVGSPCLNPLQYPKLRSPAIIQLHRKMTKS